MHLLIVIYMGDVEFTKLCLDEDHARNELADWCCDNWHDEDSSPEDFSTNDLIEWYFDNYEDYSYYRQPIEAPAPPGPPQQDILLTPAMFAIIREGIEKVDFGRARDHLRIHDELDMGENDDQHKQAVDTIGVLLNQFE